MSCLRTARSALVAAVLLSSGFVGSARALVFDFSYSGGSGINAVQGSGEFITGSTGSPYTVTGATGQANGFAITGTSSYVSADNLLYKPGSHYVDFSGISFSTSNGDAWGLGWTGSNYGIAELFKIYGLLLWCKPAYRHCDPGARRSGSCRRGRTAWSAFGHRRTFYLVAKSSEIPSDGFDFTQVLTAIGKRAACLIGKFAHNSHSRHAATPIFVSGYCLS